MALKEIQQYLGSTQNRQSLMKKGLSEKEYSQYVSAALLVIESNEKLRNCTPRSTLMCLAECASLKLSPSAVHGYMYFIPYNGICTTVLGARGMRAIFLRSKNVLSLQADVVRKCDTFEYSFDSSQEMDEVNFKFQKDHFAQENTEVIGAFAYLKRRVNDPGATNKHVAIMSKAEIDAIKVDKNPMWKTHYNEMAKKTAIRRLYKEMPTILDNDEHLNNMIHLEDQEGHTENTDDTLAIEYVANDSGDEENVNA